MAGPTGKGLGRVARARDGQQLWARPCPLPVCLQAEQPIIALRALLNGRADFVTPLGPRTVVVANVVKA